MLLTVEKPSRIAGLSQGGCHRRRGGGKCCAAHCANGRPKTILLVQGEEAAFHPWMSGLRVEMR